MFLIIFSITLLLLNIYYFAKKKYLNLFIPCMLFLPKYYGIEFSASLPILTVTRIMFIVLYVYAFRNHKNNFHIQNINIKKIPAEVLCLIGYFSLRIVSNVFYITTYSHATKTIFEIICEQVLLLLSIYLLSPTKDELINIIKSVVYTATGLFVIGIFESLTFIRPFDNLYTVSRYMLNDHYIRLGLLRATTTMGLPGIYGNMCILVLPLILYLYSITKSKRYLVISLLNLWAIIHSGSRSDFFFFIFTIALYLIIIVHFYKNHIRSFLMHSFYIVTILLLLILGLSFNNEYYGYFYKGTALAFMNELGFDFDIDKDSPENAGGFGANKSGSLSRISQFSGIEHAMKINPLFGQGSGAESRGEVMYKWNGHWYNYKTFDVGLVEILVTEGIIGLFAHLLLFLGWIIYLIRFYKNNVYNFSNLILYLMLPTYLITTLSTVNLYTFLMFYIVVTKNTSIE